LTKLHAFIMPHYVMLIYYSTLGGDGSSVATTTKAQLQLRLATHMLEMLSKGGQLTYDLQNTIALCHVEDYCTEPGTAADTDQFTATLAAAGPSAAATVTGAVAPAAVTSITLASMSTAAEAAVVAAARADVPVTPITLQSAMHSANYSAATDVQVKLTLFRRATRCFSSYCSHLTDAHIALRIVESTRRSLLLHMQQTASHAALDGILWVCSCNAYRLMHLGLLLNASQYALFIGSTITAVSTRAATAAVYCT
jgi:hypothetical protein